MTPTKKAFLRHLRKMRKEGQGVWSLAIYNRKAVKDLIVRGLAGDLNARRIVDAISDSLYEIEASPSDNMMKCLTCENVFDADNSPACWVMFHATCDDPNAAIINGFCVDCYVRNPDELLDRAADVYRKSMMPDLRKLPPVSDPGTA